MSIVGENNRLPQWVWAVVLMAGIVIVLVAVALGALLYLADGEPRTRRTPQPAVTSTALYSPTPSPTASPVRTGRGGQPLFRPE